MKVKIRTAYKLLRDKLQNLEWEAMWNLKNGVLAEVDKSLQFALLSAVIL